MSDLHTGLHYLINPQAAVAHNQAINDAAAAAAADAAKGQNKLSNDITLANVNSSNTIKENAAKAADEAPAKRAAGIRDLYKNLEDNAGFPATVGADGKSVELTPIRRWRRRPSFTTPTQRPRAGQVRAEPRRLESGAPFLASRPAAPSAPSSPTITDRSRAFWRDKGITLPWWDAQPAAPGAPVARGVLEAQGALASARTSGPGSFSGYEAQHNLGNIPDLPPAPNFVPPMQQGPKAPAPAGGESADAYEVRMGLAPAPPQRTVAIDNSPQGRSVDDYIASLKPSAAAQIAQDAKNKRLTKAQRGW